MCALKTDAERVEWSRRYRVAMRRFLRQGKSGSLLPAARLGRRAVALGLETLDVARVHEQALTALASSAEPTRSTRHRVAEQVKAFFAEAIVPIEATHRAATKASTRIDRLKRTLRRRTKESNISAGQLERTIARRQELEAALKRSADQHARLLSEAQGLQEHLRRRTRDILSAQEDERENTSRELCNEIAQSLLAVDLGLLALKTSAGVNMERLQEKIANAQRLVGQSGKRGRG